jgi:serine/threonine-protein kinase
MAPEALGMRGTCTVGTDIYSLAATIFFFIAGEYPVNNRGDRNKIINRVLAGECRDLRDLAPHVSQSLGAVISRNLSMDARKRSPSAGIFANQLANAKCHSRSWLLVRDHDEHLMCLRGERNGSRVGVHVCAVPGESGWNVEIHRDGGRRFRQHEAYGLKRGQVPAQLRKIAAAV